MNNNETSLEYPTTSDFFNQKDSCYIRIQCVPEKEGFYFTMRNEALASFISEDNVEAMKNIAWGIMYLASSQPAQVYQVGIAAQQQHDISIQLNDMPEEHQKALKGLAKGAA